MTTLTIDLPEGAFSALRRSPAEFIQEMRLAAALLWYSEGRISQSKGAEIAAVSRGEFIDALAIHRIPVTAVSVDELLEEMQRD